MIDAQLDLFVREHRDVLEEAQRAPRARTTRADRDEAEELYGDYVDAVETGTEILADMRDHYARTLDDAASGTRPSSTAPSRSGCRQFALEIENR